MRSRGNVATLAVGCWLALVSVVAAQTADGWLPASPEKLPRWRGFNLLEKFQKHNAKPFVEDDFRLIAKLGFNFVRLPLDYRCWIQNDDWEKFDERVLGEIDQAVAWGEKYKLHVCLNFHRAPGYTVAHPREAKNLWTDPDARRVCALHWRTFAKRYKDVPSERLSFNLFNEPQGIDAATYRDVVKTMLDAIRAESPDRLVICDGLEWGVRPVPELKDLRVAQATRGYKPFEVTHYKAGWVEGSDKLSPDWPRTEPLNGILVAVGRKESSPLVIEGPFASETTLRVRVGVVSTRAALVVEADGKKIYEKELVSGPGEGEWKEVRYNEQWKIHQNLFDRDYVATIPAGAKSVKLHVASGDWAELSEVGLRSAARSREDVLTLVKDWGKPIPPVRYDPNAADGPFVGLPREGREWLMRTAVRPWRDAAEQGVGVIVGEWGAFNQTPHEIVLRWSEDCLANWKEAGMGWALWNFRGPFGVLDSGRSDVKYEDFEGRRLDRQLLELLQKY